MAKRGRKSAYETIIKPRFPDILKWLQNGATEKQIADNIGISQATWCKYKTENVEFAEFIKRGRESLVTQLRGALVKRAMGFEYTEKKKYSKRDPDGNIYQYVEETTKTALPDVAALNLCLKNYDPDGWANDPQAIRLKEKELELRREIAEKDNW